MAFVLQRGDSYCADTDAGVTDDFGQAKKYPNRPAAKKEQMTGWSIVDLSKKPKGKPKKGKKSKSKSK